VNNKIIYALCSKCGFKRRYGSPAAFIDSFTQS
jgi:hypothetical protein